MTMTIDAGDVKATTDIFDNKKIVIEILTPIESRMCDSFRLLRERSWHLPGGPFVVKSSWSASSYGTLTQGAVSTEEAEGLEPSIS